MRDLSEISRSDCRRRFFCLAKVLEGPICLFYRHPSMPITRRMKAKAGLQPEAEKAKPKPKPKAPPEAEETLTTSEDVLSEDVLSEDDEEEPDDVEEEAKILEELPALKPTQDEEMNAGLDNPLKQRVHIFDHECDTMCRDLFLNDFYPFLEDAYNVAGVIAKAEKTPPDFDFPIEDMEHHLRYKVKRARVSFERVCRSLLNPAKRAKFV